MSILENLAGFSVNLFETGLLTMGTAIQTVQLAVGTMVGQQAPNSPEELPLQGSADLDQATSEFSSRIARLLRYWAVSGSGGWLNAWSEVWTTAKESFSGIDVKDPRQWLSLPIQFPLSFGSLLAQESVRGLHVLQIVGPQKTPGFFLEVSEALLDIPVYVSLQYKEEIDRFKRRLQDAPDDCDARLQLARSYIKCGLHDLAVQELALAATFPSTRAQALYESVIANYRGGNYQRAAEEGVAAIAAGVNHERIRYWTWLAADKLGGYPPEAQAEQRVQMASGRHPTELVYVDVAEKIGLDKTSGGRGTAVFDYDGDGNLDVLISAVSGGISLYHNNGDGTFSDVSVDSGLDAWVNSWGVAVGDYNNDGLPDVLVTRLGFFWGDPALFRNNGDGTFTNVTQEAGIKVWTPGFMAAWVDYNCDGLLDLFIPGNLGGLFHRNRPDCLYRNNGDGTFTEVAEQSGIDKQWPTIGACWGDFDNDGYPDLFLSSALGPPSLYHNNGDGTFTNVSRQAGITDPGLGFVTCCCDYDDDGWLDIVQFVWCPYDDMIYSLRHGEGPPGGGPLRIYHNNRNGTFTNVSRELGITESWGTMSGNAADLNNDGYLDLVLGNGGPQMDRTEPLVVLQNIQGQFRNVTFAAGLPAAGKTHGANVADLFSDGRMHIIAAAGGMYPGDLLTTSVYQPQKLLANYLNVRLVGTRSNRDAIGARVKLTVGGREQHRLVSGGTGFGSLPLEQHFGLGCGRTIEEIAVWWPSGARQRFVSPPVNATIRIVEGNSGFTLIKKGPPVL